MSEYWVSHKKYFCKYCNIYIADDVPSRRQHESGLRHKGNVERFVRGLYKAGEKKKQDSEEEKREMARVEQAAQAAFARDVGAGLVKPGSSSTAPVASSSIAPRKPTKPSDPYSNYSTAQSLGFTDPDAERLQAEAELRQTQGVAGEWELVSIVQSTSGEVNETAQEEAPPAEAPAETSKKREAEAFPEDEDTRLFKLRKKTLGVGLGKLYDPGIIPIKLKKKEEHAEPNLSSAPGNSNGIAASSSNPSASGKPKWTARGWRKPGELVPQDETPSRGDSGEPDDAASEPKAEGTGVPEQEEAPTSTPTHATEMERETADIKTEPLVKAEIGAEVSAPASSGSLFRKRKLPTGGAGNRGRRS